MLNLQQFRTTLQSHADLLPYELLLDEGVIGLKSGALLAAFKFRGPDLDSADDSELNALAQSVNAALYALGSGRMIQIDSIRRAATDYPESEFPHPVLQVIDLERAALHRQSNRHFISEYYLSITTVPDSVAMQKLSALMTSGKSETHLESALHAFSDRLESFAAALQALKPVRLTSAELLSYIYECSTGIRQPVRVPSQPDFPLDYLLSAKDLSTGVEPMVGENHVRAISLASSPDGIASGLPGFSQPGMLDLLNRLSLPYRWNTRFIPLDAGDAMSLLRKIQGEWGLKSTNWKGALQENTTTNNVSFDSLAMKNEVTFQALPAAQSGTVRFGLYTPVVIVWGGSAEEANGRAQLVAKALSNAGFPNQIEQTNAVEAYRGSLPGDGYSNVRRIPLSSRNLADLMPCTSVDAGEANCPSPQIYDVSEAGERKAAPALVYAATAGATPYRLNLHVGDVGHTLILGGTGAGKSTFLGLVISQWFRYRGAQVFAFDKGNSLLALTLAVQGQHYDVAADESSLRFAPLEFVHEQQERAWAQGWLEELVMLAREKPVTIEERSSIDAALELTARAPQNRRRMSDFLKSYLLHKELSLTLNTYVGGLAGLLDAESDGLATGALNVFELDNLTNKPARHVAAVLLYLFHQIENRLDGRPTLLVMDEAWLALRHPVFAEKLREWLKTLRKKNTAVLFATQSVTDILDSDLGTVLIESCPTKIYLANPAATSEGSTRAYTQMGLQARQIEVLAHATPKRDYFICSPRGQRLVSFNLGPVALSFIGASNKEDLAAVRDLHAQFGASWPAQWLRQRANTVGIAHAGQLPGWADLLEGGV